TQRSTEPCVVTTTCRPRCAANTCKASRCVKATIAAPGTIVPGGPPRARPANILDGRTALWSRRACSGHLAEGDDEQQQHGQAEEHQRPHEYQPAPIRFRPAPLLPPHP